MLNGNYFLLLSVPKMHLSFYLSKYIYTICIFSSWSRMMSGQLGDLGSGAGKGGGGGGSIREAGGAFGKMEAAREEEYFYKKVSILNTAVTVKTNYLVYCKLSFYDVICR